MKFQAKNDKISDLVDPLTLKQPIIGIPDLFEDYQK